MGGRFEISEKAYVKSVLHAAKHKSSAVNGVLIGRATSNDGDTDSCCVEILDCVPLFHTHLALLPMLELALLQIDEYLSLQDGGLQIVGYYHANERFDDADLNPVARKIGDHIIRYFPHAVILLLDNKELVTLPKSGSRKSVLRLHIRDSSRVWKQAGQTGGGGTELILMQTSANNLIEAYIAEGRYQKIVDFDDHLDDITKDWTNQAFFD